MTAAPTLIAAPVDRTQLVSALADAAVTVFADASVLVAYAFGSRVWGTPRTDSDLDVGYYVLPLTDSRGLPLAVELRYAGALADAIGHEVDLRYLGDAPLSLRGRVLEEGRRIYCSDDVARVNLERDLLGRYLDYKPKLEALRQLRFAALAAGNE